MDQDGNRPVGGRRGNSTDGGTGIDGLRRLRAGLTLAGVLIACLLPAPAGAAVVTIGTPTASFAAGQSSAGCNCTQYQLTAPAGYVETVPAAGVIIGWRVAGTGTLTLEALRTGSDGQLSIVGQSTSGQTASTGAFPSSPPTSPSSPATRSASICPGRIPRSTTPGRCPTP